MAELNGTKVRMRHPASEGVVVIVLPMDAALVAQVMLRLAGLGFELVRTDGEA